MDHKIASRQEGLKVRVCPSSGQCVCFSIQREDEGGREVLGGGRRREEEEEEGREEDGGAHSAY